MPHAVLKRASSAVNAPWHRRVDRKRRTGLDDQQIALLPATGRDEAEAATRRMAGQVSPALHRVQNASGSNLGQRRRFLESTGQEGFAGATGDEFPCRLGT